MKNIIQMKPEMKNNKNTRKFVACGQFSANGLSKMVVYLN